LVTHKVFTGNFVHCTNIFGYNTTQPLTIIFPYLFLAYNYTNLLATQSSFNTIAVYIYSKGICCNMFIVINIDFVSEIFTENLFAVS